MRVQVSAETNGLPPSGKVSEPGLVPNPGHGWLGHVAGAPADSSQSLEMENSDHSMPVPQATLSSFPVP